MLAAAVSLERSSPAGYRRFTKLETWSPSIPLPHGRYHDVRRTSARGCLYITLTTLL